MNPSNLPTFDQIEKRNKNKKDILRNNRIALLFFPLSFLFQELLTITLTFGKPAFDQFLLISLNSLCYSVILTLIISFITSSKARNIVIGIFSGFFSVVFCSQIVYFKVFRQYYAIDTVSMADNLFKDFWKEALSAIFAVFWKIIIIFIPFILFLIFKNKFFKFKICKKYIRIRWIFAFVIILVLTTIFSVFNSTAMETYNEGEINHTSQYFGVLTASRVGIKHVLFGHEVELPDGEETEGDIIVPIKHETDTSDDTTSFGDETDPSGSDTEEPKQPIVYGDNVSDIDFDKLISENSGNETIVSLLKYFASRTPTKQNEYTGYFEGKNLVFISLESFCGEFISESLTPTLYKMSNSGFVFTNFYDSLWGGSTSTGEYANLTGMFYNSASCMKTVGTISMPYALGNQFLKIGYNTYAFHANTTSYYNRTTAYPSLGYKEYYGKGQTVLLDTSTGKTSIINGGIEKFKDSDGNSWTLKSNGTKSQWPQSDYELAHLTVDKYVDKQPFHVYYMSISGHCNYNWSGNDMCKKHKDEVQNLGYKLDEVKAYVACQLEVEEMLTELIKQYEEAGILDNTVFVLVPDHYPYELAPESLAELYNLPISGSTEAEIRKSVTTNFDLYRNKLIIWCSSMEKTVTVTKPCSAYDILPTVSNLFGLEYDSRLMAGVDLLSDADPVVIINTLESGYDWCWITEYGYKKKSFVAYEGFNWEGTSQSAYAKSITNKVSSLKKYFFNVLKNDFYSYLK